MEMFRAGWHVVDVYDIHTKNQFDRDGGDKLLDIMTLVPISSCGRDDLLCKRDLYNMKAQVDRETYMFHANDQTSIARFVERAPQRVLYHQVYKSGPPEVDFMLGLQSKWQLGMMIQMSHNNVLCMDSTFSTTKYGVSSFPIMYDLLIALQINTVA